MLARLPLMSGMRILDLGCGTGLVGLPLGIVTGDVLGLDLSSAMTDHLDFFEQVRHGGILQYRKRGD